MKIKVTQEHIDKAKANLYEIRGMLTFSCPIARAATDALGVSCQATVSRVSIWDTNYQARTAFLPQEAMDWMGTFDIGENAQPFEFDIEIPERKEVI